MQKSNQILFLMVLVVLAIAAMAWYVGCPKRISSSGHSPTIAPNKHSIPIITKNTESGGVRPLVQVQVGSRRRELLLDTGADTSVLLPDCKDEFKIVGQSQGTDANGIRIYNHTAPVDVSISGFSVGQISFLIPGKYLKLTHGKRVWGTEAFVLGQDVLSRYRIIIDGPNGKLFLLSGKTYSFGDDWIPFEGVFGTNHLVVRVKTIQGKEFLAFLDTGYELSRISKEFAGSQPYPIDIMVGNNRIRGYTPQVFDGDDLTIESAEKGSIVIGCTLGWDILRTCRLVVSYNHRKLCIDQKMPIGSPLKGSAK